MLEAASLARSWGLSWSGAGVSLWWTRNFHRSGELMLEKVDSLESNLLSVFRGSEIV
jgi:hypothetical protein